MKEACMSSEIGDGALTVTKNHVAGLISAASQFYAQPLVMGLHSCPTPHNMNNWFHTAGL
jgi:hypothetical protein